MYLRYRLYVKKATLGSKAILNYTKLITLCKKGGKSYIESIFRPKILFILKQYTVLYVLIFIYNLRLSIISLGKERDQWTIAWISS